MRPNDTQLEQANDMKLIVANVIKPDNTMHTQTKTNVILEHTIYIDDTIFENRQKLVKD
jgi:hypothetical protein